MLLETTTAILTKAATNCNCNNKCHRLLSVGVSETSFTILTNPPRYTNTVNTTTTTIKITSITTTTTIGKTSCFQELLQFHRHLSRSNKKPNLQAPKIRHRHLIHCCLMLLGTVIKVCPPLPTAC